MEFAVEVCKKFVTENFDKSLCKVQQSRQLCFRRDTLHSFILIIPMQYFNLKLCLILLISYINKEYSLLQIFEKCVKLYSFLN